MPPQSEEWPDLEHRPRHAAGAGPGTPAISGRHRRPETLADVTRWRPAPATPGVRRRSADEARGFIELGFPDDRAHPQRRRRDDAVSRRPGSARGKHAARRDITVRPLPMVRDAVVNARVWALTPAERPAVGGHRAPGTLPVESWLLVGRGRQQALLATLVAIGLALAMIPVERHVDVHPIAAADRTVTQTRHGHKPARAGTPTAEATHATGAEAGRRTPDTRQPSATTPPPDPPPVPPGTGPARSLKVTGSTAIALTFDDGPDPVQTPKILALLNKYQAKATFCLIGTNVQRYPQIVRDIVADGQTLCNHTWDHSLGIGTESTATIRADLERTSAAIHAAAPGAPVPFFRAPGGDFTDRLVSVAYGEGMTSLYWQVDPQDWRHLPLETDAEHVSRVVRTVRDTVRPGSIVLSHDFNQPDTIEAYEQLLPYLTQRYGITVPVPPPVAGPSSTLPEPAPPSTPAPDGQAVSDPPAVR